MRTPRTPSNTAASPELRPVAERVPGAAVATRPGAIHAGIRAVSEQSQSGGVFGNLPRSRPGTRSPRRDPDAETSSRRTTEQPPTEPDARDDAPAEAQAARAQAEPTPERAKPATPAEESHGSLEDLAWAGIAAAAEAATIGVRLASRAMEAVRDAGTRT